jgi:hypothetical protein
MAVESLASSMPVVIDLVLVLAEGLSGQRLRAPFAEQLGERRHLIDGSMDPKVRTQNLSLNAQGVELRVTCDEAWWNDHELASSRVSAFVRVDAERIVSLWVEDDRSIHWTGKGLTSADVRLVEHHVGRPATPPVSAG